MTSTEVLLKRSPRNTRQRLASGKATESDLWSGAALNYSSPNLKRRLKRQTSGSSPENDSSNNISNHPTSDDQLANQRVSPQKGRTKTESVKRADASESSAQKSPAAAIVVDNNKVIQSAKTEKKSPAKRIRRSIRLDEYDEIGVIAGFITPEDQIPKKRVPNASNLEKLFRRSDKQIDRQQSLASLRISLKKNSSEQRLDSISDMIYDLPSSYIEESLLASSFVANKRRSDTLLVKRVKVSLTKRKTSLDDYSTVNGGSGTPQKEKQQSSPLSSTSSSPPTSDSQPLSTSEENGEISSRRLVSQETPPLTPERVERPPLPPSSASFASCRSVDGGGLHLASLEGLFLPENDSNNRVASPTLAFSPLYSPSPSTPPSVSGKSTNGSHRPTFSAQRQSPSASSSGTPKRPSFPSYSSLSPMFIRRRQSSASSSTSSSASSTSSPSVVHSLKPFGTSVSQTNGHG